MPIDVGHKISPADEYMARLQWIQILRAAAACSVVAHHVLYYAIARGLIAGDKNGSVFEAGVDLFFVISGFIMMVVTDPDRAGELSAARFCKSRFARIIPLYWIYTILLAAVCFVEPLLFRSVTVTAEVLWHSFFLVPLRDGDAVAPVLRVGWTLVYEAWFYAFIAATLRFELWRRALVAAIIFGVTVIAANIVSLDTELGRYLANTMMFEFLAGMLIYMGYRRGIRLPSATPLAIMSIGLTWLAASTFIGLPTLQTRFAMWGIPAAMIVIGALQLPDVKGLAGRVLQVLGDASYSIYLSHLFTIGAVYWALEFIGILAPAAFVGAALLASVGVGVVSYWMLERPLLRWARPSPRRGSQPA